MRKKQGKGDTSMNRTIDDSILSTEDDDDDAVKFTPELPAATVSVFCYDCLDESGVRVAGLVSTETQTDVPAAGALWWKAGEFVREESDGRERMQWMPCDSSSGGCYDDFGPGDDRRRSLSKRVKPETRTVRTRTRLKWQASESGLRMELDTSGFVMNAMPRSTSLASMSRRRNRIKPLQMPVPDTWPNLPRVTLIQAPLLDRKSVV